jgi:anti-sigma factor ChrR (cupin superfamily)
MEALMNDVMTNVKPAAPTASTPGMKGQDTLTALASRYVDVGDLPWKPTPCKGIDMKVLVEDPATGLLTALFRWQPGAELALHEHVEIEQTFVLEAALWTTRARCVPAITSGAPKAIATSHARQKARWCCRCS